MKIVHIISTLEIGGAECFVYNLANEQIRHHDVGIITLKNYKLDELSFDYDINPRVTLTKLQWTKKYSVIQMIELKKKIKRIRPQVVHVHLHNPLYYIFLISFILRKIRYIHTVHSNLKNWIKIFRILYRLRWLNNRLTHVFLSDSIFKEANAIFPKLKSEVINNGIKEYTLKRSQVEIESFWNRSLSTEKCFRFLAVGNLGKNKNFKLLAQVFKKLYENGFTAQLIIIGEDRTVDKINEKEITKIGAKNVFLAGSQKYAIDFLSVADALLISSFNEGMPMVALEAFSLGKPIISTPAGGMVDLIKNGYNGFLTSGWAVEECYHTLVMYLKISSIERLKLGENAKHFFLENYEIIRISQKYNDIYIRK